MCIEIYDNNNTNNTRKKLKRIFNKWGEQHNEGLTLVKVFDTIEKIKFSSFQIWIYHMACEIEKRSRARIEHTIYILCRICMQNCECDNMDNNNFVTRRIYRSVDITHTCNILKRVFSYFSVPSSFLMKLSTTEYASACVYLWAHASVVSASHKQTHTHTHSTSTPNKIISYVIFRCLYVGPFLFMSHSIKSRHLSWIEQVL